MHEPERPTPLSYLIAGGTCTVGTIAVLARILHNQTSFVLVEPFDTLTFVIGVAYALAGPFIGAWLAAKCHRDKEMLRAAEVDRIAAHLADTVRNTPPSVHYLPGRQRQQWPIAVGGEGDAQPLPTGLDPDTAAAVRSINRRLNRGEQANG